MINLSPRERLLNSIDGAETDYIPCSFMIFGALESSCRDQFELVEKQIEMGLDPFVRIPARQIKGKSDYLNLHSLPVRFDPGVTVRERRGFRRGEKEAVLRKDYITPAGVLRAEVRKTADWPYGSHVPFLDDYITPRSVKFLIETREDLGAFKHLLAPATGEVLAEFREYARKAKVFARKRDLPLIGGWGVGADMLAWVCGLTNTIYLSADCPEMIQELLDMIAVWNKERMEVILDAGVDVFIRRGWYETTDFWTPSLYQEMLLPTLKAEADLAHTYGARFGYINTSRNTPLLDFFLDAGIDVLIGVDPFQGEGRDMLKIKVKMKDRLALWGGVNGFITIERGEKTEIEKAVKRAMDVLSPGGRFILSPVDNVSDTSERTRKNILTFISSWQKIRAFY